MPIWTVVDTLWRLVGIRRKSNGTDWVSRAERFTGGFLSCTIFHVYGGSLRRECAWRSWVRFSLYISLVFDLVVFCVSVVDSLLHLVFFAILCSSACAPLF